MFCAVLAACTCRAAADGRLVRTFSFPMPDIHLTAEGFTRVTVRDCAPDLQSGRPILPVAGLAFELPSDGDVATLTLTPGALREIPLTRPVEWGQIPHQPFEPPPPDVPPDPSVYSGTEPYPSDAPPAWRIDPLRDSKLLSVQVHPVRFDPLRNVLLFADSVTVTVELKPSQPPPVLTRATASADPLMPEGPFTYVIISTSNLICNTPGPWNLQALCAARASAGFTPALVSTEWIQDHYAGTNQAMRIRAFVQDAYAKWGVQYLLLAGTFDLLPVQKLYVAFKDIFLDRQAEIPADALYYGCMEGSFDGNGNGRYGEVNDGINGGDIDLTAEVMVGRFPVTNATELAHMIRKTLRYERAAPEELRPVAHMAEKMDMGNLVYATGFMEELRNGSTTYGLNSLGFTNATYASAFSAESTLYDSDASLWTSSNALEFLNQDFSCINHIGHGAVKSCMKISLAQASSQNTLRAFTNTMPYFAYSQACSVGAFDTADCFAEQLVTVSNAAFAAVMNARDGWEFPSVVGGYSHRFHRCFWDAALRNNATRFGEINEFSRRMSLYLLSTYSANYWRWVYYELNLFGDPATPFAAAINTTPPEIAHTPLINTYDTQTAYRVTCTVEPVGIFDPDAITLVWHTDRETGSVYTQKMTQVTGNLFEAFIDPQQANTRIAYALHALNYAGCETRSPLSDDYVFFVTDRLTLTILGSPTEYGEPDPKYGTYAFASGLVASVSAPDIVTLSDDTRVSCLGFFGTGSAPQAETNQTASFRMDTSSLLVWMWQHEERLLVTSDLSEPADRVFWVAQESPVTVPKAEEMVTLSNGTVYAFTEWRLDGVRSPAAPGRSGPSYGDLVMNTPHFLEAHYLPAGLDTDTNSIPDWWEIQYYGTTGHSPPSDDDHDGYSLLAEYLDRSDPLRADSVPAPPQITFTPLSETQTHPGPFTLQASLTDTHEISSATVWWHRKTESWQSTTMQALSNDLFEAQIGTVSAPGDDFEYQIIAADPDGRTSQTDVFFLFLYYPVADTSRFHDLSFVALPTQTVASAYMSLFNTGNADLVWTLRFARVESVIDPALPCWNRLSLGQTWGATTNRFFSAPYSLYSHLASSGISTGPAVRATISLPPLLIGEKATLSFNHWIHSEVYQTTTRAFDGGIVEYSKDGGVTFEQLRGPYTHTIYGYTYSPWTNGTPCFAGNGTGGWQNVTFNLASEYPEESGFQGRSIIFRFHYGGDNNTDMEGWYIDDVTVLPLVYQNGFTHNIEPAYNFTIPAGNYKRILWSNLPTAMDVRDDHLTVCLSSNDPVNPATRFFWNLKIRDYPLLPDLFAVQSADGDGRVRLTTGVAETDGEPVSLAVDWSSDKGKTWQPAVLTNILVATGTVDSVTGSGTVTNLKTAIGGIRFTNQLSATWESLAVSPAVTVNTQMLFRVTATNGYYGKSYVTPPVLVDNVPPVFGDGMMRASPLSATGPYAVTDSLLGLAWPAATDTPAASVLAYRLTASGDTYLVTQTNTTFAVSNGLDRVYAFELVAVDPAGNASEPLTLSLPVLDPSGDYDGDGLSTADEEIAGTLATHPADRFTVSAASASGGTGVMTLSWASVAGRCYTVEATPTLLPPAWEPLPAYTDIPGTGEPITVELPVGPSSRFFRLRVYLP